MANVEEVRVGVTLAHQKSAESVAAIQQAVQSLEEAQQALATATQGTSQNEIHQALGMLADAGQTLNNAQGTIRSSMTVVETYTGRL